ncbi:thioesterase family protein [Mesorhizobium sp.]|uniref:thioesterase family protein n=1 Tax=Mesorhizobium sp. TaxID=1871066 RepID=UPI0025DBF4B1|nr:thioesterase family protein [Mesorhizobium sp.]
MVKIDAAKPQANPSQEPLKLLELEVPTTWIDYNGHMTEYRYTHCFSDACDALLQLIGADADYVKAGHSYYTVESHVRLLGEAKLGDAIYVTAQLLPSDGKKIHTFMRLYRASDDTLLSTYEHLMLHVSLKENRSVPPLPEVTRKLKPLIDAHAVLPVPEAAGRSVGQRK